MCALAPPRLQVGGKVTAPSRAIRTPTPAGESYYWLFGQDADGIHSTHTVESGAIYSKFVEEAVSCAYAIVPQGSYAAPHLTVSALVTD